MAACFLYLKIENFRGIHSLEWRPNAGVNVILGGGNVGKSTLLEAIALLLSPTNSYTLADADYWNREVAAEFLIEAVISLPGEGAINQQGAMAWPWEWDGSNAVLPEAVGDEQAPRPAVYKVRVRGTAELELAFEIAQPDGTCVSMSVALRRSIGVVKLSGDDRSDRDLRLVYGAGLDRLLADRGLRARLGREIASDQIEQHLDQPARDKLNALDDLFGLRSLPTELGLAFVGNAGVSVNALVGLTSNKNGIALPLISWGSGTRRLAALAIADSLQEGHPITVVDELERGLEPYRQRQLMKTLIESTGQAFVTTHSSTVVSASGPASLWYIDSTGSIGALPRDKVERHQSADPEAFLSRLTIVAEGSTEVGFLAALLDRYVSGWRDQGIYISDATGNDNVLNLLEALSSGGVKFAGFADFEGRFEGRWQTLRQRMGNLLFQWQQGCLEENIIPLIPSARIFQLIEDPAAEKTGMRLRTLADRLEIQAADFDLIADRPDQELKSLIVAAATGQIPEHLANAERTIKNPYKGHSSVWFKSVIGGRELADKIHALEAWPHLQERMVPFLNAIRTSVGLVPLPEVEQ
jgi:putative ATP-dependent endonuclease of OLD family